MAKKKVHSTTILCVSKDKKLCIMSDSQVTAGSIIEKDDINKLRALGPDEDKNSIVGGFSGVVSDCFTITDMLRTYLKDNTYNLEKAIHNLIRDWRKRENRHLRASMIVADNKGNMYYVEGEGLIIKPSPSRGKILAGGSGSIHAYAAALALYRNDKKLTAKDICEKSMKIASELDIYTNDKFNKIEINLK